MTARSSSPIFVADRGGAHVFDAGVIGEVETYRSQIDGALARLCDSGLTALHERTPDVAAAVRYSLLGGGKRFRGILLLAGYRAAGGTDDAPLPAAAIEIVHAYSLVHDDLPCMDDDDMRRGRPTVYQMFGVPAATAAGVGRGH